MQQLNEKCSCAGANLDKFVQPVILSVLSKGADTGYGIMKHMSAYATMHGSAPDPTGIYRMLHSMEERGLIAAAEERAANDRKLIRVYRITEQGQSCLSHWKSTLLNYSRQLQHLTLQLNC